ncbi:TRAP transporter large permease [Caenispirillum bisanense]|uniref:C4-dicarboxylate transporter, DctM subunit n=1 Tax=Caenispirillum bisanense TaxID=414052 RepID=A0A286GMG3_9PROT|nr:TRAP transporter large permease subunit [Caenispirillum bisanense]SOD96718.1 C4-dicarboxylate transporter, DctM subunit [Caenispirillum bisanense]
MTSVFLFVALFGFMLLGMPIAVALGLSSSLTILLFSNDSIASVSLKLFEALSGHYTLLAIPFFILSSAFLSTGGVARRIIRFALSVTSHIRGGMAMASVVACMIFAAVSGSSPATVAAIGGIVIGGMVKAGYPLPFATGVIANAGTLGILIPPSIVMLVYATATEVSAARMFMAGVLPGLGIGAVLLVAIYIFATIKKLPRQAFPGWREVGISFADAIGGIMLIVIVLGSIYGGIASPTEAAALSAVYAYLVAVFFYRDIGPLKNVPWRKDGESLGQAALRNFGHFLIGMPKSATDKDMHRVVMDAAKVSIMLLFIIANAMLFAHVLTTERIPHTLASMITDWGLTWWGFLIVCNILLLIAGNFMEPSAIVLIMAPILMPIGVQLGIDPIHLGIIMVVNMEIGMITPPVGLNLFVASGITGKPILWVVRACLPWLLILIACLMVVTYWPWLSLWLPSTMYN